LQERDNPLSFLKLTISLGICNKSQLSRLMNEILFLFFELFRAFNPKIEVPNSISLLTFKEMK
jgi:hypothetical protein